MSLFSEKPQMKINKETETFISNDVLIIALKGFNGTDQIGHCHL